MCRILEERGVYWSQREFDILICEKRERENLRQLLSSKVLGGERGTLTVRNES